MFREAALSVFLVTATLAFVPAGEAAGDPLVVAVLDTGIVAHSDFAPGQIAYWWGFTDEAGKTPAQIDYTVSATPAWDPYVGLYDLVGHGTNTASLVSGKNVASACGGIGKSSYAPAGVTLAIAKVGRRDPDTGLGVISGDPTFALQWAIDVAGADVVSMSFGSIVPGPGLGIVSGDLDEAIHRARERGVLVVVSAGNGAGNLGLVPVPSWSGAYGFSTDALIVGGGSRTGSTATSLTGDSDPEVSSWSDSVCAAMRSGSYGTTSGTSFSAPLVAGAAASAIQAARASAEAADPDTIETVLKAAARDTIAPYTREGWGFIGAPEASAAKAAAGSGTLPAHPCTDDPTCPLAYEALVADTMRATFSETLDGEALGSQVFAPADLSPPGHLAPSTPEGGEAEIYVRTLASGETASVAVDYAPGAFVVGQGVQPLGDDFDVRVYVPGALDDGVLDGFELVRIFGKGAGEDERAVWTAHVGGDYVVVVYGWSNADDLAFSISGATYAAQGILVGEHVVNP